MSGTIGQRPLGKSRISCRVGLCLVGRSENNGADTKPAMIAWSTSGGTLGEDAVMFAYSPKRVSITLLISGVVLTLVGLALIWGGVHLTMLGGSYYYAIVGLALAGTGILLGARRAEALWLFAAATAGTVAWALWEVGLAFWPLVPRLAPFMVMALIMALLAPLMVPRLRRAALLTAALASVLLIAGGFAVLFPHGEILAAGPPAPLAAPPSGGESRWQYYGRSPAGTRFAPETQITPANVKRLKVAWTFRTGEIADGASEDQNTPIQIGDTLYACTPLNKVIALDADTGKPRWVYDPKPPNTQTWNRCRGVAYYAPAVAPNSFAAPPGAPAASTPRPTAPFCGARIVLTTLDARLIQLDAGTGRLCDTFGTRGTVDLRAGMGEIKPGWYQPTSTPTVIGDRIIVGGWVFDGRGVDEPSGVVRAFDARTGALVWAWDIGRPDANGLPPEGESYSRSTPNVWSTPSFDEALGLVYLPTGNQNPDFWGALRPPESEKYSSSLVALDVTTGKVRWHFQTAHHDIWDYDVPAQPALYDIPDGRGGKTPAVIQVTKRGQIFMFDRRDGTPLAPIEERPVPQSVQPGDRVSPTQPYSRGMPAIGAEPVTEKRMWGATFFDQLACRIRFRQLNYKGEFTPVTTKPTLIFPGYYGGMNWGSVAIDARRNYLIINDIRMPQIVQLIPQEKLAGKDTSSGHGVGSIYPQEGAPYAAEHSAFNSPLGVPCLAPPWGTFTAVDLNRRSVAWQRPAGTVRDAAVSGIKAGLPIPLGMPTLGGPIATASGLIFYAGTQDYYLRALDTSTGRELWKGRLPVGAQATPMTYASPRTGRQYVVISAGGARQSTDRGDYIVAFALPRD